MFLITLSFLIFPGCNDGGANKQTPKPEPNVGELGGACLENRVCLNNLVCSIDSICIEAVFFKDSDGDSFGDPDSFVTTDIAPKGYVTNSFDCDDTNPEINPDSKLQESINHLDDVNCDGTYFWLPTKAVVKKGDGIRYDISIDYNPNEKSFFTSYSGLIGNKKINMPSRFYSYNDDGKTVIYQEHDSGDSNSPIKFSEKYTYDENGNQLTYEYHDGDLSSPVIRSEEYTYDENGNRLTYKYHDGGLSSPVTSSEEYIYDRNGKKLTYTKYHGNGDLDSAVTNSRELTYDKNGYLITDKSYHGDQMKDWKRYTYDNKGNILTYEKHESQFSNNPSEVTYKEVSTYTNNKISTFAKYLNGNQNPDDIILYAYDDNGYLIKEEKVEKSIQGKENTSKREYKRDSKGNIIEITRLFNNTSTIIRYDSNGNISYEKSFDPNEEIEYSEFVPIKIPISDISASIYNPPLWNAEHHFCYIDSSEDSAFVSITVAQESDGIPRKYFWSGANKGSFIAGEKYYVTAKGIKISNLFGGYICQEDGPPPPVKPDGNFSKIIVRAEKHRGCASQVIGSYDVDKPLISAEGSHNKIEFIKNNDKIIDFKLIDSGDKTCE